MESHLKTLEDDKLQLTIVLQKEELQTYIKHVEQEALTEVQVDGFRKGKAPEDVSRKQLDTAKVLQTALENALEHSLAEATKKENLDVFKISDLAIKNNTAERLEYSVSVTPFPAVKIPDLAQFKAQRKEIKITDKEIDETLEVVRDSRATFTLKEEPAVTGDRVEIDFEVQMDGKIIEGGESKNHPLIIGGKNFIPGFEDNLVGMKKGEEKNFSLKAPDDYYQKSLAGKKLDFKVTIKTVQSVARPELNDAFAQGLGKFQNIDQLKGGVREGIYEEKRQKEKQRIRLEILDQIIKAVEIKLPRAFIDEQTNSIMAGFERDLSARGMELGMYLAHLGKTQDDLRKEWRPEAERQAKIAFIIHRISRDKDIVPTEEEITAALSETVQALAARGQMDPAQVNMDNARRALTEQITNEKTREFIDGVCASK
ncbi:MAG: trigger factor [Patescibacteria group bacterium]